MGYIYQGSFRGAKMDINTMQKCPPHLPHTRLALVFFVYMGGSFAKIVVANILWVRVRVFLVFIYYKKSFKDVQPALLKSIQFIYSLALWEAKL